MHQKMIAGCLIVRGKAGTLIQSHQHYCAIEMHWPGVYSVQKPPDEWPDIEALIDNNYRNMLKRDIDLKGREAAVEESFCGPR